MTPEEVGGLISTIGLLTQIGGALLLVVLFAALLRGHPRRQPYFRLWTTAWVWLLIALIGVLVQYTVPQWVDVDVRAVRVANIVYQAGKLVFVLHLVAGTLNYVNGVRPRRFLSITVPIAFAYALLATLPGVLLNSLLVLQAPLVTGPFAFCAWMLLRLPASRATLGSRATGAVFGMIAVLWILYALAFAVEGIAWLAPPDGPFTFLLRYNSYLDLMLQMLLGYGMVVVLLEDAKRETDDARAQLAIANDQLKRDSLYDALTGAMNRRAYDEGVGLEGAGARFGTAMVLDLDNLKVVNDSAGHAAGDELLRRLVDTLRHCVRPLDRIYRLGGDEFLVLFPTALPQEVHPRLRSALEASNDARAEGLPPLEVSVGAASFAGIEGITAAVERADRAMYEDKARNRGASPRAMPAR
jgi:diguanylate cyclase (GGDEF)-like protein